MAITLRRQFTINVQSVVSQSIEAAHSIRREERALKEAEFQKAISDGLSYNEQVRLRQKQLESEKKSGFSDAVYIADLEKSITNTKKLSRFNKYREKYAVALGDLSSGKINEEQYLNNLKQSISDVTDPDLRVEIQGNIASAEKNVKQYHDIILSNQVKKAKFDGTESSLKDVLSKIKSARASALVSDNQDEVTAYNETLSAVESQLFGVRVQNSLSDFQVQSSTRGMSPLEKLNFINKEVSQSDFSKPVRIGNVSYNSAQEFWSKERDGYLAGTSQTFGNFFDEIKKITQDKIDTNVVRFGYPPQAILDDTLSVFNDLKTRPEVAPFLNKVDITQAAVMVDAVDKFAKKVIDSSETSLQFEVGIDQLKNLGQKYGVNTEMYTSQLFQRVRGLEQSRLIKPGTADKVAKEVNVNIPDIKNTPTPTDIKTPTGNNTQRVVAGDTLSTIAQNAGIGLTQLLDLNPQFKANPDLINPGQEVTLPASTTQTTPTPTPTPQTTTPTPTPQNISPNTNVPKSKYTGSSIVDYLRSTGADSSLTARTKLASNKGIQDYTGNAEQNTKLLNILRQ